MEMFSVLYVGRLSYGDRFLFVGASHSHQHAYAVISANNLQHAEHNTDNKYERRSDNDTNESRRNSYRHACRPSYYHQPCG